MWPRLARASPRRARSCLRLDRNLPPLERARALAAHGRDGDPGPDRLALFVVLGQEVETCVLVAGRALARRVEVELLAQLLQPLASGHAVPPHVDAPGIAAPARRSVSPSRYGTSQLAGFGANARASRNMRCVEPSRCRRCARGHRRAVP